MAGGLAALAVALRAGLGLRRQRTERKPRSADLRRRHLAWAKPAVFVLLVGFVGGAISSWWLRGWTPFTHVHGWIGLVAAALLATAATLGRRLERGDLTAREAHALVGVLAGLAGALALMSGFVLLP